LRNRSSSDKAREREIGFDSNKKKRKEESEKNLLYEMKNDAVEPDAT